MLFHGLVLIGSLKYLYLCDQQGYYNRAPEFFSLISLFTEWSKLEMVNLSSVHNKFKFVCISGTFVCT